MKFKVASKSDAGNVKKVNQDSYAVKMAKTSIGNILMVVVCDGMGGLEYGEVASGHVVRSFQSWFTERLPQLVGDFHIEQVKRDWSLIVESENNTLRNLGEKKGVQMGTTLTAALYIDDYMLFICHIGDCRLYRITEDICQMTEDQTWVAKEVKHHRMTEEQAQNHPKRNMLLQCIGVLEYVEPVYSLHRIQGGDNYLLCSDGFRHHIKEQEMKGAFEECDTFEAENMTQRLVNMIELCKARGEKDNITAVMIHLEETE